MHVIATAGHVDHGKSSLVRALTGTDPDRWEEEHRRGLTIDLGYAWTTLPSGEEVAFVDVPGHQRFIGNMLAGLGPAAAVMFVVAADEGWQQQSGEHLAAVRALHIEHGLVVVTKCDLASPSATIVKARRELEQSSLGACEAVEVSVRTGEGLDNLRQALHRLAARMPEPRTDGRVRLWVDRSFTIKGSGTVVTGTLGEGTIRVGEELEVDGRRARVRGLQSLEKPHDEVRAVARVAVNLAGLGAEEIRRGDTLLTPAAWPLTSTLDARVGADPHKLPSRAMLHVGTAALEARIRPLSEDVVRLTLARPVPVRAGDRAILRDPGQQQIASGVLVVDADPPGFTRRGAAAQRGHELATATGAPDLATEVGRRHAMRRGDAAALGLDIDDQALARTSGVVTEGDWLVSEESWHVWGKALEDALHRHVADHALDPTLTLEAARSAAGIPDRRLVAPIARDAGLDVADGRLALPGVTARLSERAEKALEEIERRLREAPFAAPEQPDLDDAGLGPRELGAVTRAGRFIRLDADVLLLPDAPALAMRRLAALDQPFTTSDARAALGTTRRVAIPLLEHLDARGWTRRVDANHREVRR